MSCVALRSAEVLDWHYKDLTADDIATLGMILRTSELPRLQVLDLGVNGLGDAGMQALCEGLGQGAALSLRHLCLGANKFGPAGAEALAAALGRGALPKLDNAYLNGNPIGNQGAAVLAASLRTLPALTELWIGNCEIGDKGVASLVANLGKDDFKKLEHLFLCRNKITDVGLATLFTALDAGGLPHLRVGDEEFFLGGNPASDSAVQVVIERLAWL